MSTARSCHWWPGWKNDARSVHANASVYGVAHGAVPRRPAGRDAGRPDTRVAGARGRSGIALPRLPQPVDRRFRPRPRTRSARVGARAHQGRRQQRSGHRLYPLALRRLRAAAAAGGDRHVAALGRPGAGPAHWRLRSATLLPPSSPGRVTAAALERRGAPPPQIPAGHWCRAGGAGMSIGLAVAVVGLPSLALAILLVPLLV